MSTALIGYTGFVGSSLATTCGFDFLINRANLESLRGADLKRLVCAGLPAAKWRINQEPKQDLENMRRLEKVLNTIHVEQFILISTIDVYPCIEGADEAFDFSSQSNHPYGTHRLQFESFVRGRFPDASIVRLPALFGPGLRKNVLYDLLHNYRLERINPASCFQWYPLEMLREHLIRIESLNLRLVNLFTEPIETQLIVDRFFPGIDVGHSPDPPSHYDLHTRHGEVFSRDPHYVLDKGQVLKSMETFIHAERYRT